MSNKLFAYEKTWVDSEFQKVEARIKELGLELGEAMDQSSETWHDNGPADVIMNEVGALWSKHAWLRNEQAKMVKPLPTQIQKVELGHHVTLKSTKGKMNVLLGHINIQSNNSTCLGQEAPLAIQLIGKKLNDTISVGSTTYTLHAVDVYSP